LASVITLLLAEALRQQGAPVIESITLRAQP
jgi:hypothetical protein